MFSPERAPYPVALLGENGVSAYFLLVAPTRKGKAPGNPYFLEELKDEFENDSN